MAITPLPTPPSRQRPTEFSNEADAFLGALPTFGTEANALALEVNGYATTASTQAGVATTKAQEAEASAILAQSAAGTAGAIAWVSGTAYTIGDVRYSTIDFQNYRRKTNGAGTTDPSLDTTNWAATTLNPTSTVTLTNKTIEAGVFTNGYTEETFAPAAGSTFTFDFANGTIQSFTTNANTTISLPAPSAGKSFQIQVVFGGAHTLTFNGGALSWGDTTPAFSGAAGKTDVINFTCNAAGTKWFGSLFGKGYA